MPSMKFIVLCFLLGTLAHRSRCNEEGTTFSTRTLYDTVRGSGITPQHHCRPVALWALIRDGVSYPSSEEIKRFTQLEKLRDRILENHNTWNSGELSEDILESLSNWQLTFDLDKANHLAPSGEGPITSFIERLISEFPYILGTKYNSSHKIRTNTNPGTIDTANIISLALYNHTTNLDSAGDVLGWLQTTCPAWTIAEQRADAQAEAFRNSKAMTEITQKISNRLGFSQLRFDLIGDIYKLCSFESAINPNSTSPWCSIFTKNDLDAFEYEEDILTYYTSGPGNSNSIKVACNVIKVLLQNLELYDTTNSATIQMANSLTIRAVLNTLGLVGGEPLSQDTDFTQQREWSNANLTPFLGNIVTVLNDCPSVGTFGLQKRIKTVSIYLNEKRVVLPWCPGSCELEAFKRGLSSITDPSFCNTGYCFA